MHSLLFWIACACLVSTSCSFLFPFSDFADDEGVANCFMPGTNATVFHGDHLSVKNGQIQAHCHNGKITCYHGQTQVSCALASPQTDDRLLGVMLGVKERSHLWPKGILCYQPLQDPYTHPQKNYFQQAVNFYNKNAHVQIITVRACRKKRDANGYTEICGNCRSYIHVHKGHGCHGPVGYVGRKNTPQQMSLNAKCFHMGHHIGNSLHELGHSFGLFHEHTHPDRQVIVVPSEFAVPARNYKIQRSSVFQTTKYDPISIMHYPLERGLCLPKRKYRSTRFCDAKENPKEMGCVVGTRSHCATILPTKPINWYNVGQRERLTANDLNNLKVLYNCKRKGECNPPKNWDGIFNPWKKAHAPCLQPWDKKKASSLRGSSSSRGSSIINAIIGLLNDNLNY